MTTAAIRRQLDDIESRLPAAARSDDVPFGMTLEGYEREIAALVKLFGDAWETGTTPQQPDGFNPDLFETVRDLYATV